MIVLLDQTGDQSPSISKSNMNEQLICEVSYNTDINQQSGILPIYIPNGFYLYPNNPMQEGIPMKNLFEIPNN